jgi:hypothetical protein
MSYPLFGILWHFRAAVERRGFVGADGDDYATSGISPGISFSPHSPSLAEKLRTDLVGTAVFEWIGDAPARKMCRSRREGRQRRDASAAMPRVLGRQPLPSSRLLGTVTVPVPVACPRIDGWRANATASDWLAEIPENRRGPNRHAAEKLAVRLS